MKQSGRYGSRIFSAILCGTLLTACGGGGGGGGSSSDAGEIPPPVAPPNAPPSAEAGSNQTIAEGTTVVLDGSGSLDSDGGISAYQWSQTSGPDVLINNADQSQASFAAPDITSDTVMEFQLIVTDNDGSSETDTVTVTVEADKFTLSGTITTSTGTTVDGDVNDPNARYIPNDDFSSAQAVPNPITIGGYVNVAQTGTTGRSFENGDVSDYFRVNLIAGQTIALFVADFDTGDPDLYLWDSTGTNILDFSASVGSSESLIVPFDGEFLVEAHAFAGASNYTLIIGQTQISSVSGGFRLSDDFVPGEAIIRYDAGFAHMAKHKAEQPFMARLGLKKQAGAPDRPMLLALKQPNREIAARRESQVSIDGKRVTALADDQQREKYETLMVIKALNQEPAVEYAQPNYIVQAMMVPNDQYYPLQWHYPLINLPAAWDIATGDPSVTVAVIDTGVLLSHPDLQGQLVAGYDFVSNAQMSADGDGIDPNADDPGDSDGLQPSSFHGTHVAGTVAASSNDGAGVAGVAWGVKIMPLRVLGVGGGTAYDIDQSVRYAAGLDNDSGQTASPPVDVINLSLGGSGSCSTAAQELITTVRQAGVTIVAAAGNETQDVANSWPANCDGVIAVSAVSIDKTRAPYSNFGAGIDVAAPGGNTATDLNGDGYVDGVLSAAGDDSSGSIVFTYPIFQGTSMASPHMAGVVALMKSANPGLTPSQIDQMLANGELTDDLGDSQSFGNGLINAHKAVVAALNAAGTPPADNPTLGVSPGTLNFDTATTVAELTVRNTGGGSLQADPPVFNAGWLSVAPVDVSSENLGTYAVIVDRSGLADGTYSDVITIQSTINTVQISIIMQVSSSVFEADAGFLYTLLIDSETGMLVQESATASMAGEYEYQFVDVPDGSYKIIAGTDSDNDFIICDAGEACGGYLTLIEPSIVTVGQDATGLDFSVSRVVAIPAASLKTHGESPPGFRRSANPASNQLGRH